MSINKMKEFMLSYQSQLSLLLFWMLQQSHCLLANSYTPVILLKHTFYSISPLLKNLKSSLHKFWNTCAFPGPPDLDGLVLSLRPFPYRSWYATSIPSLLTKFYAVFKVSSQKSPPLIFPVGEKFPCLLYNTVLYYTPIVSFY